MKSALRILLAAYFYVVYISSFSASATFFHDQKEEESFNLALRSFQNLQNRPTCFFSYAGGLGGKTVDTLAPHLETAGINILHDVEQADFIVVCGSKELINAYNNQDLITPTKIQLDKINQQTQNILSVWLEGNNKTEVLPKFLWDKSTIDFRKQEDYCLNCFELLRKLYKLDSNDSFLIQIINGHKAGLLNPSVINPSPQTQNNQPNRLKQVAYIATAGVAVLAAFGVSQFWGNDSILGLNAPCNPSLLRNGICYPCDNGAYPLIHYNLTYWPHDGCPPELAPELVYGLGNEPEKDYRDYLTQLQNATFLEDQKNITARCAEGLKNVTASALARIGIKTNFNKGESKNSGAKFRFLLNDKESPQNGKDKKCVYNVTKDEQPTEVIVTAQLVYPTRLTVPETKPVSPTQESKEMEASSATSTTQPTQKLTQDDIKEALNKLKDKTLSWADFASFISSDPNLTRLDLSSIQIIAEGAKALAEALKTNTALTKVDLSDNKIGDEGAKALAEALKTNTALKEIYLYYNQIGDEGTKALAVGLKANKVLTTVSLHNNKIGDEGAKALAEGLKVNTALTAVYLSANQIGDEGAKALAEGLKANTVLTKVYFHDNQIGDAGAKALAEGLKINKALTTVYLSSNKISDEGAKALAVGLKDNTALKEIYLHNNMIGNEGAKALAEGLKANIALTTVYLNDNQIGDEGAKALAEGLKDNKALKEVNLYNNQIGDEGAKALAEGLKDNKALKEVNLYNNQIGDEGRRALEDLKRSRSSLKIEY